MQMRFIGKYTGGRTSIVSNGVTFTGRDPSVVVDPDAIRRLSSNVEFEAVERETLHIATEPKKRGRPRKVAD